MSLPVVIGERLQLVIKELGWSQERLAVEMDANPSTVSRWANGNPLSKTSLKRFLKVTGASENFMIAGQEPMFETERPLPDDDSRPFRENKAARIDANRGSRIAFKVLSGGTRYAGALWENLLSFEAAAEMEEEMHEMKHEVQSIRKENREMADRMERMEEMLISLGATLPEKKSLVS